MLLIMLGLFSSAVHVALGAYTVPFWFCYFGPILAGIGLLIPRPSLIFVYVSVGLVFQTLFSFDLVRVYLSLPQFFGLVHHDPLIYPLTIRIADLLVHIAALPLALVGSWMVRVPSWSSFVRTYLLALIAVGVVSFLIGDVNCVDSSCVPPDFGISFVRGDLLFAFSFTLPLVVFWALGGLRRMGGEPRE